MSFHITRCAGRFRWYLKAEGKVIARSEEAYLEKRDCLRSIDIVRAARADDIVVESDERS